MYGTVRMEMLDSLIFHILKVHTLSYNAGEKFHEFKFSTCKLLLSVIILPGLFPVSHVWSPGLHTGDVC